MESAIDRVRPKVLQIDRIPRSTDEHSQLFPIQHPQPPRVDKIAQPGKESIALSRDLRAQPVVRDPVDVLKPVLPRHRNVRSARHQFRCLALPKFVIGYSEVERKICLHVTGVVFELQIDQAKNTESVSSRAQKFARSVVFDSRR